MGKFIIVKWFLLSAVLFSSINSFAGSYSGYVCKIQYFPKSSSTDNNGNHGYVQIQVNSGAACTGSILTTKQIFSVGATNPAARTSFLHSGDAMMQMWEGALKAASSRMKIRIDTTGTPEAVFAVSFESY